MELELLCKNTSDCKVIIGRLTTEEKNKVLHTAADLLIEREASILEANATDIANAVEKGMATGMIDRLRLTSERIADMADGLRQVANLNDPVGEVLSTVIRPNGMEVSRKRVPLGVVGMIY